MDWEYVFVIPFQFFALCITIHDASCAAFMDGAALVLQLGVSVDMQYTESGSGAMSREARYGLFENFGQIQEGDLVEAHIMVEVPR